MEINDLYNKLNNMKIKYKLVKKKLPLNREELTTHFISDELLSKIDWNYTSYIIEINNKPEIYINSNTKLPKKIILTIIKVKKLLKNKYPLYINLFLTNERKQFTNKKMIGPHQVNSGSTTTFIDGNENGKVFIWRKEELQKVLIHELLHAFRMDTHCNDRVSEGHIEACATILTIILNLKNEKGFNKEFKKQKVHFEKQMGKIYNFVVKNKPEIDTHVNEYYFDKAFVLEDPQKFMKYMMKNNFKYNEKEYKKLLKDNQKKTKYKIKNRSGKYLKMMR